jgi:phospholipid-translocating ATPase
MSLFKRHQPTDADNTDEENDETIDPELRLRTVRTAASAIAESIKTDQRAERRKSTIHRRSRFFRSKPAEKKPESSTATSAVAPSSRIPGARRNIYVNHSLSAMEVDHSGEPKMEYVRNKVRTTSESYYYFLFPTMDLIFLIL